MNLLPAADFGAAVSDSVAPGPEPGASLAQQRRVLGARMERLVQTDSAPRAPALEALSGGRLAVGYALDESTLAQSGELRFFGLRRRAKQDGTSGVWQVLTEAEQRQVGDPVAIENLMWLRPRLRHDEPWASYSTGADHRWQILDGPTAAMAVPRLARADFLFRLGGDQRLLPLRIHPQGWRFEARVERRDGGARVVGEAVRGEPPAPPAPAPGHAEIPLAPADDARRPLASPGGNSAAPWRTSASPSRKGTDPFDARYGRRFGPSRARRQLCASPPERTSRTCHQHLASWNGRRRRFGPSRARRQQAPSVVASLRDSLPC